MTKNPENQFDFWLGKWDVAWGADGKAINHVLCILDGKVIQENFSSVDLNGVSVSVYDPERGLWCQTWVGNNGTYLDFTGKFEDGKMILVSDAIVRGEACKQRMFWYNVARVMENQVRKKISMSLRERCFSARSNLLQSWGLLRPDKNIRDKYRKERSSQQHNNL